MTEGNKMERKVLGVKVAPVNIPVERRLQTVAVLFWMLLFLFCGLIGTGLLLYTLFYTRLWPLSLAYITFIWWDLDTMNRGGRKGWTVRWLRSWRVWKYYADFFPIKIVK